MPTKLTVTTFTWSVCDEKTAAVSHEDQIHRGQNYLDISITKIRDKNVLLESRFVRNSQGFIIWGPEPIGDQVIFVTSQGA